MDFLPTSDDMRVDVKRVVDRVDGALPVVALAQIEGAVVQSRTSNVCVPADRRLRQSQILTDRQKHTERERQVNYCWHTVSAEYTELARLLVTLYFDSPL